MHLKRAQKLQLDMLKPPELKSFFKAGTNIQQLGFIHFWRRRLISKMTARRFSAFITRWNTAAHTNQSEVATTNIKNLANLCNHMRLSSNWIRLRISICLLRQVTMVVEEIRPFKYKAGLSWCKVTLSTCTVIQVLPRRSTSMNLSAMRIQSIRLPRENWQESLESKTKSKSGKTLLQMLAQLVLKALICLYQDLWVERASTHITLSMQRVAEQNLFKSKLPQVT